MARLGSRPNFERHFGGNLLLDYFLRMLEVKSVSTLMCLLRGSCALSRIVLRKKILNCRAYTGSIERVKQFVRARRAPKIIFFWDTWIIRAVRNYRTTRDLLIRRES